MAFPKWLTPEGNLGVVPELDYYEYLLDAYDPNFGNLVYSRISGILPPGIQVIDSGKLVGIPVSTPTVGADKNQEYTFSLRVVNDQTGNVTDRTFNLTITNVAPPIITPKTVITNVQLQLIGNISANIGDYLTQSISSANAIIKTAVTNSGNIVVNYVSNSSDFILGRGNLTVVSANISLYPTVSYAAYPVIATKVSSSNTRDLGLYFDGAVIDLQLEAIEFSPSAVLTWTVKSGEIPPGLTLSTSGLLSGYIFPIPTIGPGTDPDWDEASWDFLPWDATQGTTSKNFSWTIEVTDGVNYDTCTYTILVYPRRYFTADSTLIKVDATVANSVTLSVDTGSRHYPIILSTQSDIPTLRQGDYFDFQVDAIDLDEDILEYSVPALSTGAFDEQNFTVNDSIPYITDTLISGNLFSGVFPKTTIVSISKLELPLGYRITANVGQYITQVGTSANARVTANVANSDFVLITLLNTSSFTTSSGNLILNGNTLIKSTFNGSNWSNLGIVAASVINTPQVQLDNTTPELFVGDRLQFLQLDPTIPSTYWYSGTVNNKTTLRLSGNTIIAGNTGQYLTQSGTTANATIVNVSATTGTVTFGGNSLVGTITIYDNILTANVGDVITQPSTGANATLTSNVIFAVNIPVTYTSGTFIPAGGWLSVNGTNIAASPLTVTTSSQPITFKANAGDIITQAVSGANATVLEDVYGGLSASVQFNGNVFTLANGNIKINGGNIGLYPTSVTTQVDIAATYNSSVPFTFNTTGAYVLISNVNTYAIPTKVISVGVTAGGVSTQGVIGYDEGQFDQGALNLPQGLTIDSKSGWLTGTLPSQTVSSLTYDFSVVVSKRDYLGYSVSKQFTITVLGDLNNRIDWITPSYLGTIENGAVSALYVEAVSSKGKILYYEYSADSRIRLPQGLELLSTGLISGRVSFQVFSIDQGQITIDGNATTFDNTYLFKITARDLDNTASASRVFTVRVVQRNIIPYENLYLKALTSRAQRVEFQDITQDRSVFPLDLIYRNEDPFYGIANDIKTLFIPGLTPSQLSAYTAAASTNHFTKRIIFGQLKTAVATDGSYDVIDIGTGNRIGTFQDNIGFVPLTLDQGYIASATIPANSRLDTEHIKYEVVYFEVLDENSNSQGDGPADTINLTGTINPYYDLDANAYTIAYPNSFENMSNVMVNGINYTNKGALPDWMTTKQPDGRVPGFTRAVVLAYTLENASETIAYRFRQAGYDLNQLDFTVDRYQLDNIYSANFDITNSKFIHSKETTFDRYPGLASIFNNVGTVDYAVTISFEKINQRSVTSIVQEGGLDGINSFQDGEQLVFFNQEFELGQAIGDTYNLGWSQAVSIWDGGPWDYDTVLSDNPYTEQYGYYVTSWVAEKNFNEGTTVLNGTKYYRTEHTFTSNSVFSTSAILGNITIGLSNSITANIGDYITQPSTGANLTIKANTVNGFSNIVIASHTQTYTNLLNTSGNIQVNQNWLASNTQPTSVGTQTISTVLTELATPTSPDLTLAVAWDAANYVTGYNEHLLNPSIVDKRIGIWQINVDSDDLVTLTFVRAINYYDNLFVRNGFNHGETNIYYDPVVKNNRNIPNYSIIPQQINIIATTFDGNGTKFLNYRDSYSVPEQGDKYIKFTKIGVFT